MCKGFTIRMVTADRASLKQKNVQMRKMSLTPLKIAVHSSGMPPSIGINCLPRHLTKPTLVTSTGDKQADQVKTGAQA